MENQRRIKMNFINDNIRLNKREQLKVDIQQIKLCSLIAIETGSAYKSIDNILFSLFHPW